MHLFVFAGRTGQGIKKTFFWLHVFSCARKYKPSVIDGTNKAGDRNIPPGLIEFSGKLLTKSEKERENYTERCVMSDVLYGYH